MDIILCISAVVCALVGVVGSVIPAIPGPPIAYVGVVLMAFTSAQPYSWVPLVVYGVLTAVVQIADFVLPSKLTAKFGGSKSAERGSTIGTILGMFFVPWGLILFPFFGALIGEWMNNKQASAGHLFKVAFGAFLAFLFGTGLKLILTCWMLVDVVIEICAMLF